MKKKLDKKMMVVDVLCGGQSEEHEISIISAVSIINSLITLVQEFRIHVIYITLKGEWYRTLNPLSKSVDPNQIKQIQEEGILVFPSINPLKKVFFAEDSSVINLPDLFFPVLHGKYGEDGTIQGLFEMMNVPYVGSGVLGSSCGMDKDVMKRLFQSEGLPVLPWKTFYIEEWKNNRDVVLEEIKNSLKYPLFIKPSSSGSSIGISKILNNSNLIKGICEAFSHSSKILVEEGRKVREIECAVSGNFNLKVSAFGEIIAGSEFYDYDDKYNSKQSELVIPAHLSGGEEKLLRNYAEKAYHIINARGLSRIDFFICQDTKEVFLNEINTFPGFTNISMYPKLWEHSGISFKKLVKELIFLGFETAKPSLL